MASDENVVRTDVECHRCNATFEAEVDISEEGGDRAMWRLLVRVVGFAMGVGGGVWLGWGMCNYWLDACLGACR